MRETNILTSHFSFDAIKKLDIYRAINEHGVARLEGHIKESDVESYRSMLMEDVWLQISGEDDEGNTATLFYGIITDFSLRKRRHNCELGVTVMTGTYLMDIVPHLRSFQDGELTYYDVMDIVNEPYHKPGVIGDAKAHEPIEAFVLQNNETDWAFIKRLASKCGSYITPAIDREGVIYYFGNQSTLAE